MPRVSPEACLLGECILVLQHGGCRREMLRCKGRSRRGRNELVRTEGGAENSKHSVTASSHRKRTRPSAGEGGSWTQGLQAPGRGVRRPLDLGAQSSEFSGFEANPEEIQCHTTYRCKGAIE